MPKVKIGEFLNKLATKSGIDVTNKHLIDLLSKSELANTEVDDELTNAIDAALMTVEAAKANPDVIKKIRNEAFNSANLIVEKMLGEFGYDGDDINDIKTDKNTFQKIEKMARAIHKLEGAKAKANAPDKAAIQKQIDDLNGKIVKTTEDYESKIKTLETQHTEQITNLQLKAMLAAKKFALPDDMTPELKADIALSTVKADLAKQGFQIVNVNGALEVKRADGTDAYDTSNIKVDLTKFIDGSLATNKLLAVNEAAPAGPAAPAAVITGPAAPAVNHTAIAMIDQHMAEAGVR